MKKRVLAVLVSIAVCLQSQPALVTYATEPVEIEPTPVVIDSEDKVECICETPCTEGLVNQECPVCKAEGADLTKCVGAEETTPTIDGEDESADTSTLPESEEQAACICETPCTEGLVNQECPVCKGEHADLSVCKGQANEKAAEYNVGGDSWSKAVSPNGNEITTYINEDEGGETRKIHWANGVKPPIMGGPNSEFEKVTTTQGGTYIEYIAPYVQGNGWYDANKEMNGDQNLCFVAATANSLQWWFDRNAGKVREYLDKNQNYSSKRRAVVEKILNKKDIDQHNSLIYQKYRDIFNNRPTGYWPDLLIAHFINGYPIDPDDLGTLDPDFTDGENLLIHGPRDEQSGYFYDIFKKDLLSNRYNISRYDELKGFLNRIDNGELIMMTYAMSNTLAHVVTLWGVEYNEAGNPVAVYYTDSDDANEVKSGMRRYKLVNKGGVPYISTDTTNQSASKIITINTLSTGDLNIWDAGIQESGKGKQNPPETPTVAVTTENSITLKGIKESGNGTKAEYSNDNGLSWRVDPKFEGLKPGTKYTFYARYQGNDNFKPSEKSKELIAYTSPSITTASLPNGKVGVYYEQTLKAQVQKGTTVTWSAVGSLPDGLSLDANGIIRGTPTTASEVPVSFQVEATANGVSQTKELGIIIDKGTSSFSDLTVENATTGAGQFVYGDEIIIKGKISTSNRQIRSRAVTPIGKNQVALFVGDTQLTQPTNVGQDGSFLIKYNTADNGITASNSEQILTVKYGGSDTLDEDIAHVYIRISPKSIGNADVTLTGVDGLIYDGNEKTPAIEVKLENQLLNPATDYTVNYFNSYGGEGDHTNAGEVTVTITGKGNYGDSVTRNFMISKASAPNIQWPTASVIEYGQSLADSKLTGGSIEFGSFAWTDASIMPQSGTNSYRVTFIPSADTKNNYDEISVTEQNVEVNVEKANPVLTLKPSAETIYGGGEVTLILTGLPVGAEAVITCSDTAITLHSSGENTWNATLPDRIQTYTFSATYYGDVNYNGAQAECKVDVAPKSDDNGGSNGDGTSNGGGGSNGDGTSNGDGASNGDGTSSGTGSSNGNDSSNGGGGSNGGGASSGNGVSNSGGGSNGGSLSSGNASSDQNQHISKIKNPETRVQTPTTAAQKEKNGTTAVKKSKDSVKKDSVKKAESDAKQRSDMKNGDKTMENGASAEQEAISEQEKNHNLGLLVFPILFILAAVIGGIWFLIRRNKR